MDLISKYELIERIVQTTDENVLMQVKHVLDDQEEESWENMDPELKASLKRGLVQSDKKQGIPHEKVMAEIKKKHKIK